MYAIPRLQGTPVSIHSVPYRRGSASSPHRSDCRGVGSDHQFCMDTELHVDVYPLVSTTARRSLVEIMKLATMMMMRAGSRVGVDLLVPDDSYRPVVKPGNFQTSIVSRRG